jgi:hypothetical protein
MNSKGKTRKQAPTASHKARKGCIARTMKADRREAAREMRWTA